MDQANQAYNIIEVFEKNIYQSISIANSNDSEEELFIVNEIYDKKGIQTLAEELKAIELPYAMSHKYEGDSIIIVTQGAADESLSDYINNLALDNLRILELIENFLNAIRVYDATSNLLTKMLINLEQVSVRDGKIVMSDLLIIDDVTHKPATFKDVTNNISEIIAVLMSKINNDATDEKMVGILKTLFLDLQEGIKYTKINDIYMDYKAQQLKDDHVETSDDQDQVKIDVKKSYLDFKKEKEAERQKMTSEKDKVSDLEMLYGDLEEEIKIIDRTQGAHAMKPDLRRVPAEVVEPENQQAIYAKPQMIREVAKPETKKESKEEAIEQIKRRLDDFMSRNSYEFEKTREEIRILQEEVIQFKARKELNQNLPEDEIRAMVSQEVEALVDEKLEKKIDEKFDEKLDDKIGKKVDEKLKINITSKYGELQELIVSVENRIRELEKDAKVDHIEELDDTNRNLERLKEQFDELISKFGDVETKVNANKELKLVHEVYEYLNREDANLGYLKRRDEAGLSEVAEEDAVVPIEKDAIKIKKTKKKVKLTPKGYAALSASAVGMVAVLYLILH